MNSKGTSRVYNGYQLVAQRGPAGDTIAFWLFTGEGVGPIALSQEALEVLHHLTGGECDIDCLCKAQGVAGGVERQREEGRP